MSLRTAKLLLIAIIGGFLLSAAYVSVLVIKLQYSLQDVSRYRPSWDASQATHEFLRFAQSLSEYGDPGSSVDKDEVRLRFEVLMNRANSFVESDVLTEALTGHPEHQDTLRHLSQVLLAIEPLIDNIDQLGAPQKALQTLKPLESTLVQIAALAHFYSADVVATEQRSLLDMHWRFTGIVGGLILFGILLIMLLVRHLHLLSRAHEELYVLAHHDHLTGLTNRTLFQQKLEATIDQPRVKNAVLLLDLDRFKDVNDSFGHGMGDTLLMLATERLRSCVSDGNVIARLGGDEFAILQTGVTKPQDSAKLAARIVEALGEPYVINGHEIVIGASVGIAVVQDEHSPSQILQFADMALYRAKAAGRGTYQFFEPEMNAQLQARQRLEQDLRKAVAQNELELAYQPIVDLTTFDIVGFEALLRWNHPNLGLIQPSDFISLAEETGLIVDLGRWVLQQACAEAVRWPHNMRVSVNLSPVQFRSRDLAQEIWASLEVAGLSPDRLELEITESVLLQENDHTLTSLHKIKGFGVHIALDDFGTGFSSLSYLRRFPFDKIKVDQLFVRDMEEQGDSAVIVQSIAHLGASLRMTTTAEGVETKEQLMQLRAAGCTQAQGFYFSRPKPPGELEFSLRRPRSVKATG